MTRKASNHLRKLFAVVSLRHASNDCTSHSHTADLLDCVSGIEIAMKLTSLIALLDTQTICYRFPGFLAKFSVMYTDHRRGLAGPCLACNWDFTPFAVSSASVADVHFWLQPDPSKITTTFTGVRFRYT